MVEELGFSKGLRCHKLHINDWSMRLAKR